MAGCQGIDQLLHATPICDDPPMPQPCDRCVEARRRLRRGGYGRFGRPQQGEPWTRHQKSTASSCPSTTQQHVGITTYDAKDPDTSFPPITEPRPPAGAPNVLIVLLDDIGFGASSAFGGAVNTPTADRLAAGGIKLSRFHTTALCAPTQGGPPHRAEPSHRGHGVDHRDGHLGSRVHVDPTEVHGTAGRDPEAERLLDGPVRQMPRGPGVEDQSGRTLRPVAHRERLRLLLRLHRRRDQPVLPGPLRGHDAGRAAVDTG